MKNLDESRSAPLKNKDINTFKNNQLKFTGGATNIPPDQMKCNILKARMEEDLKKGWAFPEIVEFKTDPFIITLHWVFRLCLIYFSCINIYSVCYKLDLFIVLNTVFMEMAILFMAEFMEEVIEEMTLCYCYVNILVSLL